MVRLWKMFYLTIKLLDIIDFRVKENIIFILMNVEDLQIKD